MNPFYQLNPLLQWSIALIMCLLMMLLTGIWMTAAMHHLFLYLLLFIAVPIFQFLSTPIFRLIGTYTYLSPMVLVFGASKDKYDLHNGTSFDYLLVMRKYKAGLQLQQKMLEFYIEGLLKVIEKIESKELPETVVVRGSSYFFSERTAQRLGFKISGTNFAEKLNLAANYLDLVWMYSISQGKLQFPSLSRVKTASISGADLLNNKTRLEDLYAYLNKKSQSY